MQTHCSVWKDSCPFDACHGDAGFVFQHKQGPEAPNFESALVSVSMVNLKRRRAYFLVCVPSRGLAAEIQEWRFPLNLLATENCSGSPEIEARFLGKRFRNNCLTGLSCKGYFTRKAWPLKGRPGSILKP